MEVSNGNNNSDYSYSSSLDLPCKKHPSSSSVGICAYCLKDRLIKLVCSDCGEQRLSSCSCSDFSSYRNSCSTVEVGSVGRISFLIENEKTDPTQFSKPKIEKSDEFIMLKRSSSSCTEVKRSNGFWRIRKFFRKKRGKQGNGCEKSVDGFDVKSDMWVSEYMGVSRSRSLCSFRGNLFNDPDREGSEFAFSSAKISDVNEAEPRRSGFSRGLLDAENGGDLNELNSGASVVPKKCSFPVKESDLKGMDESGFIDLKLDLSSEPKTEYSALKMIDLPTSVSEHYECGGNLKENRLFGHGGSCRITVNEKRIKKGSKGRKIWSWIFSHHHHGWTSASKKEGNHVLKL